MTASNERTPLPPDPDLAADERTTLVQFLDYFRGVLLRKVDGIDDEMGLRRACPPSTLCLTGLVRHMAEMERLWFAAIVRGAPRSPIFTTSDQPDHDIDPPPSVPLAPARDALVSSIAKARTAIEGVDLDQPSGGLTGRGTRPTLRWVMVHMIEEYARHCGHADLLREAIDGVTDD